MFRGLWFLTLVLNIESYKLRFRFERKTYEIQFHQTEHWQMKIAYNVSILWIPWVNFTVSTSDACSLKENRKESSSRFGILYFLVSAIVIKKKKKIENTNTEEFERAKVRDSKMNKWKKRIEVFWTFKRRNVSKLLFCNF